MGTLLFSWFGIGSSSAARAQEGWTGTPTVTPSQTETPTETTLPSLVITETLVPTGTSDSVVVPDVTGTPVRADYYSVQDLQLSNGNIIQEMLIHGPPVPPIGYEIQRQPVSIPEIMSATGTNILIVPAVSLDLWLFCSIGRHDRWVLRPQRVPKHLYRPRKWRRHAVGG